MKRLFIIASVLAALAACAAPPPPPLDTDNCAIKSEAGETDGGYGGTGNTPEGDCFTDS